MKKIIGTGASVGITTAKAYILINENVEINKQQIDDHDQEIKKFDNAILKAKSQIIKLKENAKEKLGEQKAAVFDAHLSILTDPELALQVKEKIKLEKVNVAFAVKEVAQSFKNIFSAMDDDYMKERIADIADVTSRLIKIIEGFEIHDLSLINEEVIIVANDLTPSETSQLNPKFVKGFITAIGGRTSHSAIMARTLEIPAVVGIGTEIEKITADEIILMDGNLGEVFLSPTKKLVDEYEAKAKKLVSEKAAQLKFRDKKTISKDNWATETAANIGSPLDLDGVIENGAEAIGLFRTEFLYMEASNWPTEEQQFKAYKAVLEKMGKKRVVIRTLDIGGDKILSYYDFPKEMNPFLGYRAIRVELDKPKVLEAQFRALLRASAFGNLAINVPMIATIDEFLEVKANFSRIEKDLKKENIAVGKYELGIMVEIPSVVELADKFAKYADFFSVGTNDLIQYTFAADRMGEAVAYLYQPFNPAILKKLKTIIDASHKVGKWTAICGEVAGEPKLTPILMGLGLDEFSMSASSILQIRKLISEINLKDAKILAKAALELETQDEVIALIDKFFADHKLEI